MELKKKRCLIPYQQAMMLVPIERSPARIAVAEGGPLFRHYQTEGEGKFLTRSRIL
jgi:hypothetical protein